MTTEQPMLTQSPRSSGARSAPRARRARARRLLPAMLLLLAASATQTGCAKDTFVEPRVLVSPYSAAKGDALLAVAPLRNESGVGVVDPLAVSDSLAYQLQQVRGVSVIPVNRTIAAMRALGIQSVDTPVDALRLAQALGADAIVVGTITAWNPYDPPTLGLTLALIGDGPAVVGDESPESRVDPRSMRAAASDYALPDSPARTRGEPLSITAEHFDGASHEVQLLVRNYAEGRHDPKAPFGWRRYLASMTLFTEFACHRMTERLLDQERLRLAQPVAQVKDSR